MFQGKKIIKFTESRYLREDFEGKGFEHSRYFCTHLPLDGQDFYNLYGIKVVANNLQMEVSQTYSSRFLASQKFLKLTHRFFIRAAPMLHVAEGIVLSTSL